ncbi:MAG: PspC domain-containing protein [Ardenticatenaceae bacterium]|nr:PspC domain-containing protein [Ardenticatenaceae bacterium]MCB8991976.1 PspC domain-containing protein [Ardenticatenaceae bacterium]MCB9004915.1 PspC domain-containing protein [Ardenticatenaceae bacterium]
MDKRLVRKMNDRMVFGVASGLAEYLSVDPVLIRLIFVIMTLAGGPGLLLYLVMAILMPEEGSAFTSAKAQPFDEEEIVVHD